MKIERKVLLAALKTVEPAIADKTPLNQLLCVWFSGKSVFAYNDVIGVDIPLATDFQGGVLGKVLLGLVSNSAAKNAAIEVDGGDFELTLGGATAHLASVDYDSKIWELPELPKKGIPITNDLLDAMQHVMVSASEDIGVSFIPDNEGLTLYSTDERTGAWSGVSLGQLPKNRVEVPPTFCTRMMGICKDGGTLFIEADFIVAKAKSGAAVFSRLIQTEQPLDYETYLQEWLPKGYQKQMAVVPKALKFAIERALVLSDGQSLKVRHKVEGGALHMDLNREVDPKAQAGHLHEKMVLENTNYSAVADFDVSLIKRGLARTDKIMFTDERIIMTLGDHSGYVVSNMV